MSEPSFIEKLAMMKLEEEYPNGIKELDELSDKEKQGTLTPKEKKRLNFLDKALLTEYDRCKLHYNVNWNFMRDDVKADYKAKVDFWWKRKNPSSVSKEIGENDE